MAGTEFSAEYFFAGVVEIPRFTWQTKLCSMIREMEYPQYCSHILWYRCHLEQSYCGHREMFRT